MERKDKIYLGIIIIIVIIFIYLYMSQVNVNARCAEFALMTNIKGVFYQSLGEIEKAELIESKLSQNGFYNSPGMLVYGKEESSLTLWLKNNFNVTKEFSIEILPNHSFTPYVPYENISVIYPEKLVILPGQNNSIQINIFIDVYDFDFKIIEKKPQYIIKIMTDGEEYGTGSFWIFAIPQKVIDDALKTGILEWP